MLNNCIVHLKAPSPPPLPMVHLDDVGGSSNKPALIPKIKLKVVPPNDAGSTKGECMLD